jgi:putative protease
VKIAIGDKVYRNNDEAFNKVLGAESAKRKIKINIAVNDKTFRFSFGEYMAEYVYDGELDKAQKDPSAYISTQLSKLGDSIFEAGEVNVDTCFFFPASILGNIRRTLCEELVLKTSKSLPSPSILPTKNNIEFPLKSDSYLNNIANAKAMEFYYDHGAKVSARAFEVEPKDDATLMFCKHCIRFALGACTKGTGLRQAQPPINESLFLIHKNYYLRLHFNCKDCVMEVRKG